MGNGKPTSKKVSPRASRLTSYQNSQSRKKLENYIDIKIAPVLRAYFHTNPYSRICREAEIQGSSRRFDEKCFCPIHLFDYGITGLLRVMLVKMMGEVTAVKTRDSRPLYVPAYVT